MSGKKRKLPTVKDEVFEDEIGNVSIYLVIFVRKITRSRKLYGVRVLFPIFSLFGRRIMPLKFIIGLHWVKIIVIFIFMEGSHLR